MDKRDSLFAENRGEHLRTIWTIALSIWIFKQSYSPAAPYFIVCVPCMSERDISYCDLA